MLAAGEGVVHAQADYEMARWQIVQQVKATYWAALGSQKVRDVLKTTADNFQRIVGYHSAQLTAGAIAEQDFLRVRLEGERLQISADLALIEVNRLVAELLKEMGETNFTELAFTEPLIFEGEMTPLS